jgi:hypothetical protein
VVPAAFTSYFVASSGASAALIGLLFVAVALAPERTLGPQAPAGQRARAVSAFFALLDAFFMSIVALIPHTNLGYPALLLGAGGLVNTLGLGRYVWHARHQRDLWRSILLLVGTLTIYVWQLWYAVPLIRTPDTTNAIYGISYLLLGAYGAGVARAWDLLGATDEGLSTVPAARPERVEATPHEADRDSASPAPDAHAVRPK